MKKLQILFAILALALAAGCATDRTVQTKRRAVQGGLGGAILGGIIGHQSGRGLEGAAVGAGAGAAAGGLYGSSEDETATQSERR